MKQFGLMTILALSACTAAINDPEKFDRYSEQISKTYNIPRDKLYACFMDEVGLTTDDLTYQTKEAYTFKKPGLVEVNFKSPAPNKTIVISQAAKGGDWTIKAQRFIEVSNECAMKRTKQ